MKAEGGEEDARGAERWDALLQGPRGNPARSAPWVKLPGGPQGVCPGLLMFIEGALGSLLNIVLDVVLLSGMESKLNKTLRRRSQWLFLALETTRSEACEGPPSGGVTETQRIFPGAFTSSDCILISNLMPECLFLWSETTPCRIVFLFYVPWRVELVGFTFRIKRLCPLLYTALCWPPGLCLTSCWSQCLRMRLD